jgi:hypothetical protein
LYLGQFDDWVKFTQNAASAELTPVDVDRVFSTTARLVERLEAAGQSVNPEVPRTIAFLNSLIAVPGEASRRAAYAVLRTIENLVAKVFLYGAAFLDDLITRTSSAVSSTASKAIVVVLLTVALDGAVGLTPVVARLADAAWMEAAVEVVRRQIDLLVGS